MIARTLAAGRERVVAGCAAFTCDRLTNASRRGADSDGGLVAVSVEGGTAGGRGSRRACGCATSARSIAHPHWLGGSLALASALDRLRVDSPDSFDSCHGLRAPLRPPRRTTRRCPAVRRAARRPRAQSRDVRSAHRGGCRRGECRAYGGPSGAGTCRAGAGLRRHR